LTPPNAERTPTATWMEKEKQRTCRRAGVVLARRVGSESGERWTSTNDIAGIVMLDSDRGRSARLKMVGCCVFYCGVVGLLMITAACSHPDGTRHVHISFGTKVFRTRVVRNSHSISGTQGCSSVSEAMKQHSDFSSQSSVETRSP
jgi:hypothetical protein